jgi:hypothetical protein
MIKIVNTKITRPNLIIGGNRKPTLNGTDIYPKRKQ